MNEAFNNWSISPASQIQSFLKNHPRFCMILGYVRRSIIMLSAVTGSFVSPIAVGVGLVVVYNIALALYRLTLHPLAKFPGPKFAAVSGWYEFWYELNHRGDFLWHIRDLHDKYGKSLEAGKDTRTDAERSVWS